jgi:hypothetical protein
MTRSRVHGFTPSLTRFIGRAGAADDVTRLLGACRLVTVTGPGGVGKTRLAAEVAERVSGRFTDGVWLVELATVLDPAQVPAATAAALGIREQPGVAVTDVLAGLLARQQMLLVLKISPIIGMGKGRDVKELVSHVPVTDVDSIEIKRLLVGKVMTVTVRGAPVKLEVGATGDAKGMADGLTRAKSAV